MNIGAVRVGKPECRPYFMSPQGLQLLGTEPALTHLFWEGTNNSVVVLQSSIVNIV